MLLNRKDSLLALIDVQKKLIPAIHQADALVSGCAWLMKLAQRMQVPIVVSEQYPTGLGKTVPELCEYFNSSQSIEKVHFSCMQEGNYVQHLKELNKNQLVLCGIEAHVCVLQTAMEMKQLGFYVFVVVDAVGSRAEQDLKYGLKRMKQAGIHLITREMVFFEWLRQAGTLEFKALSKEFLQGE